MSAAKLLSLRPHTHLTISREVNGIASLALACIYYVHGTASTVKTVEVGTNIVMGARPQYRNIPPNQ